MRKLASIQTVNAVEPIPNADAIERVRVLGWWVVAKKGEHAPGNRVVYLEIDSLLPTRPEFEFLRPSSFKPEIREGEEQIRPAGFRIKTIKLRGQVSQGICFPLAILPAGTPTDDGADVTAALGVIKYEAPLPASMGGAAKGPFPGFLPKTDETRVQVLEDAIVRHRGKTFYITEKLDGSSFSAYLRGGDFGICSRNLRIDETSEANLFARLARSQNVAAKLAALRDRLGHDVAIQGEAIGPSIQQNKYALREVALKVFSVIDLSSGKLLDRDAGLAALAAVGFDGVPQLGEVVLNHGVDELVAMAVGTSVLNPKVHREGIVLRPAAEEEDTDCGGRLSFKAINPQFLLKYDE